MVSLPAQPVQENAHATVAPRPSRLTRWWRRLIGNRAGVAEIDRLDPEVREGIQRDLGASRQELRALAGKWPSPSTEFLSRRMQALGLDLRTTIRSQPAVAQDLQKHCSLCDDKSRCSHNLDRDPANPAWRDYCLNAHTLDALRRQTKKTG